MLTGCSNDSTPDNAISSSAALPTAIPAGTKLVIADQQERIQTLLRASGELDRLPFAYEFANFVGGPSILEAFRAGSADVAGVGDVPPIQALLAGQDVPIIAAAQSDPNNTPLAVAPGQKVEKLADLKGKKIAYAEGTAQQAIVLRALAKANLKTSDVELVRLQLADFNDAVRTGQVDVAPLNEPRLTRFLKTPGSSTVPISETDGTGSGLSFVYARREAIQDPGKAAALQAFDAAYIRAVHWSDTHPDEWVQKYYVDSQKISAEDGKRIVASLGNWAFPHLDDALVARQQATIDVLDKEGQLPKKIKATDGFDLRFDAMVTKTVNEIGATFDREKS
ncbi:ABC transporter substrate-binding protein [Antrihabitans cavernicola]|uniref:ABC transporter substrate-binding protein n=1 Tax=Antrihabitans cavernicola TaxID=2495913 RepID=A0A5A7S6D1_9NOCA|nr:ABC transporter substrate-binding protein [Spelaeibacter cavernicola]